MLDDVPHMEAALAEADAAAVEGEVPVGCVIVDASGSELGRGRNARESLADPTAHAEMIAIRAAAKTVGGWRLEGATAYVTLEPCAMCAGAIVLARIPEVVFGAPDPKAGACGSVLDVLGEPRLNHRPRIEGGVLADECGGLLRDFFAARR